MLGFASQSIVTAVTRSQGFPVGVNSADYLTSKDSSEQFSKKYQTQSIKIRSFYSRGLPMIIARSFPPPAETPQSEPKRSAY